MPKTISVDFFRVEMPANAQLAFEDILDEVAASPVDNRRNAAFRDHYVRIQACEEWHRCRRGDMLRIRMDTLPPKADLGGHIEPLALNDDEGLGEQSAFLYDPATRVLAIQRNRAGVSAGAMGHYCQTKGKLEGAILMYPVIREDALRQLARMTDVRKMEIAFAGLENADIFADLNTSVAGVVDISEEFRAPNVSLTLSMGYRRGSLNVDRTVAFLRRLTRRADRNDGNGAGTVARLEVFGKLDGEETVLLDLLEYRMVEAGEVQPDRDRMLPYQDRLRVVSAAWEARRAELRRMFRGRDRGAAV